MTSLFVITNEYRQAAQALADLDLDAQTVADTLEGLSGEVEHKAQAVAAMVRNLEVTAEAIKAHEEAQRERRKAIEARAERLRDYLANCLAATGIEKIEGPGIAIGWRKSSAVVIDELGLVPAEFLRTPDPPPPSPDKASIGAALKAGRDVPGARIEHRRNLQIKA